MVTVEILKRIGPKGKLIAFDQDKDALNTIDDARFLLINENFMSQAILKFHGLITMGF